MKKELKWFKFDPAKWMMGRIMREPDEVQSVFLRLCCQYWFNQCKYSYDDAKYETKDIIDILIDAKIVNKKGNYIHIAFLDEQKTDAQGVSGVRRDAANERWRKQKDKDAMQNDANAYNIEEDKIREDKEKIKSRVFKPPTLEEVISYCQERENKVDAERFINFYESKGWMIGKNKIKNWKAAVRNWEKSDKDLIQPSKYYNPNSSKFPE